MPRGATWFTPFGRHTLYGFLLHEVVLGWRNRLVAMLPLPVLTSLPAHILVLASQYAVCVGILVVLCSAPTRRVFGLILEPEWLYRFICAPHGAGATVRPSEEVIEGLLTRRDPWLLPLALGHLLALLISGAGARVASAQREPLIKGQATFPAIALNNGVNPGAHDDVDGAYSASASDCNSGSTSPIMGGQVSGS